MKKILWLIGIALCLYNTSHAQFYLKSEGNKSVEEQYQSWLSTTEAPTNELNFELKPQEEQQKYNQEKEAYIKKNNKPYEPVFWNEWQATDSAPINWRNFHLKSEGNKSVEEQYQSWLSTIEAPTNELNFELKPQEEQQKYNQKKKAFLEENNKPYEPVFWNEWQATDSAPINWSNFHLKSQEEQEAYKIFVNQYFENSSLFHKSFLTLNLSSLKEPFLTDNELAKKELYIKNLFAKCTEIIGYEAWEDEISDIINRYYRGEIDNYYKYGPIPIQRYFFQTIDSDMGFMKNSDYHALDHYAYKCVNYLYFHHPHKGFIDEDTTKYYKIDDFEYDRNLTIKEEKVEKLYEEIYLNIKKAGLLRRIQYIYYPKSFLREHADEAGLTEFIKVEERQAGKKLDHEKLAIQFFETREKWLTSLNDFIAMKINFSF